MSAHTAANGVTEPVVTSVNGKAIRKPDDILNLAMTEKFLTELHGSDDYAFEIRILDADTDRQDRIVHAVKFPKTIAGYFLSPADAIRQIRRVREVSVYVTVNPVLRDLMARGQGPVLIPQKNVTNDNEIACIRNLFLDFDVKRPSGISSTDAE